MNHLLNSVISSCLENFRCKLPNSEIETSLENYSNFIIKTYCLELDHFERKSFYYKNKILKNLIIKRKSTTSDNENDNNGSLIPIWGISSSRTYLNNKQNLLRISCNLFAEHKWNSLLQLTNSLLINNRIPGYILMKNFFIFLYEKPPDSEMYFVNVRYFIQELLQIMEERFETLIELTIFLINHKNMIAIGKKFITDLHLKNEKNLKHANKSSSILGDILEIYKEYLEFIEWKANKKNNLLLIMHEKMINNFKNILNNVEHKEISLDIVILILLDLNNYKNEFEESLRILQLYTRKFPDNLNGHVYLYEFLMKFPDVNSDFDLKFNSLKQIIQLCPDSKYTLRFVTEFSYRIEIIECLELIANYVDYKSNRNSHKAWKILNGIMDKLEMVKQKDEMTFEKIQRFFLNKLPYWQRIHFCLAELQENLAKLKLIKQNKIENKIVSNKLNSEQPIAKMKTTLKQHEHYHLFWNKAEFLSKLNVIIPLDNFTQLVQYKDCILAL